MSTKAKETAASEEKELPVEEISEEIEVEDEISTVEEQD